MPGGVGDDRRSCPNLSASLVMFSACLPRYSSDSSFAGAALATPDSEALKGKHAAN